MRCIKLAKSRFAIRLVLGGFFSLSSLSPLSPLSASSKKWNARHTGGSVHTLTWGGGGTRGPHPLFFLPFREKKKTDPFVHRDAFAGGFVAGIVEGKPLDECVDMGQWLAKLSIQELGPQYVVFFFFSLKNYFILSLHSLVIWFSPFTRTT